MQNKEKWNLALYHPKKDECEKCIYFKNGSICEEEYESHMQRKQDARNEKDIDKREGKYVFAVTTPKLKVSTVFYKTKLQVHNLCIYNVKIGKVLSVEWNRRWCECRKIRKCVGVILKR